MLRWRDSPRSRHAYGSHHTRKYDQDVALAILSFFGRHPRNLSNQDICRIFPLETGAR